MADGRVKFSDTEGQVARPGDVPGSQSPLCRQVGHASQEGQPLCVFLAGRLVWGSRRRRSSSTAGLAQRRSVCSGAGA